MSYTRVIPRDLFNEGNLLKCYGQLYIGLEKIAHHTAILESDGKTFDIHQDPTSGALTIINVTLMIGGKMCYLERPLNSRDPFPLYINGTDCDPDLCIEVFTNDGELSEDFVNFLKGKSI